MSTATPDATPRSVAVVRALAGIGDMLCVVPALRSLRAGLPDAHIALVGLPWAQVLVERFPDYVDELIPFPGFPGIPEVPASVRALPFFAAEMQAREFDLALQMQGSGYSSNPFTFLLGAKRTAGFHLPGTFVESGDFIPYPGDRHELQRMLALTASLGMPDTGEHLEWPVRDADHAELDRELGAELADDFVILHVGSSDALRRWPVERFAQVGDHLACLGLQVVLTGVAGDAELTGATAEAMHAEPLDATGRTTFGALGALVERARLVVCNDTGISHIAAALRRPSVVVFSGSDPRRWAPLDGDLHRAVYRPWGADECAAHEGAESRCLKDGCHKLDRRACALDGEEPVAVCDVLDAVDERLAKEVVCVA